MNYDHFEIGEGVYANFAPFTSDSTLVYTFLPTGHKIDLAVISDREILTTLVPISLTSIKMITDAFRERRRHQGTG